MTELTLKLELLKVWDKLCSDLKASGVDLSKIKLTCPNLVERMSREGYMRKKSIFATIDGVEHSLTEWAEITGIQHQTIYSRYMRGKRGRDLIKEVKK